MSAVYPRKVAPIDGKKRGDGGMENSDDNNRAFNNKNFSSNLNKFGSFCNIKRLLSNVWHS